MNCGIVKLHYSEPNSAFACAVWVRFPEDAFFPIDHLGQVPSAATTRRPHQRSLAMQACQPSTHNRFKALKAEGLSFWRAWLRALLVTAQPNSAWPRRLMKNWSSAFCKPAATAELEKKRHHRGQRQAPCPGEVAGLDAMGLAKRIRVEDLGKLGQQLADKRCGAYG